MKNLHEREHQRLHEVADAIWRKDNVSEQGLSGRLHKAAEVTGNQKEQTARTGDKLTPAQNSRRR
jgi:hypothetical protein